MLSVNLGTNDSQNGFIYFNEQRNPMKKICIVFKESRDKDNVLSLVSISAIIRKPWIFQMFHQVLLNM